MDNAVKLCGLWKQTAKKGGVQFLSGKIGPTSKLIIFKNDGPKKAERSPDYVAYLVPATAPKKDGAGEDEVPF